MALFDTRGGHRKIRENQSNCRKDATGSKVNGRKSKNLANTFEFVLSRKIEEIFHGIPNFGCAAFVINLEAR